MAVFKTEPPMHYDGEHDVHYEVFGYTEFIDYCMNLPKHESCGSTSSDTEYKEEMSWAGTKTYEEAVSFAKTGWDAGLKEMKDYVETDATLINVENALVGHYVDVGRFLSGVPDSMVSFYDDSYRNKAPLTVYTKLTYLADISGEQAMEYCAKILDTLAILNRTFNVKLVGVFTTQHSKTGTDIVCINIKDTDERFVMNNLAFAYNPAFFRRFWFKWLEGTNFWESGYGRTPTYRFGEGKEADCLTKLLPPNEQVLFMPDIYHMKEIVPTKIAQEQLDEQIRRRA
tara:strand:+ start:1928 stop:2782 length:855 start_codon:yes stop_codon:yes gene_type:complete